MGCLLMIVGLVLLCVDAPLPRILGAILLFAGALGDWEKPCKCERGG